MKKKLLIKEALLATLLVAVIIMPLSLLPLKSEFVRPIKQELDDFDIYDLIYSGKDKTHPGIKDPNIVLIQSADDRSEIASQIEKIKKLQPAVVGVDLSFEKDKETVGDLMLKTAMLGDSTIVPGYSLDYNEHHEITIKEEFFPKDYLLHNGGFINFPYAQYFSVVRNFAPFYNADPGPNYSAFSVRIASLFRREAGKKIRERSNSVEVINYYGNSEYYLNYSAAEFEEYFKNKQLRDLKGKIILLGYFADESDANRARREDMFFSPLNQNIKARSFPDIYGVVIHANILSMLLSQNDYITVLPVWASFLIGLIISFFVNWIILYCYARFKHPYHIWFFIGQLLAIVIVVYLAIKMYDWFGIKTYLLPIILALVLSVELFDVYRMVAKALHKTKRWRYQTIFLSH